MIDRRAIVRIVLASGLLMPLLTLGAPMRVAATTEAAGLDLLAAPGAVVLMRHALAPGGGDPPGLRLDDCRTQRNLSAEGRAQAQRIGEMLRARGLSFDRVMSSEWCRARDTAELVVGRKPEVLPSLNSLFGDRAGERDRQMAELTRWIDGLPRDARVLLVTHQVVIQALAGVSTTSGEMVVLRREAHERLVVAGRVPPVR